MSSDTVKIMMDNGEFWEVDHHIYQKVKDTIESFNSAESSSGSDNEVKEAERIRMAAFKELKETSKLPVGPQTRELTVWGVGNFSIVFDVVIDGIDKFCVDFLDLKDYKLNKKLPKTVENVIDYLIEEGEMEFFFMHLIDDISRQKFVGIERDLEKEVNKELMLINDTVYKYIKNSDRADSLIEHFDIEESVLHELMGYL